MTTREIGSTSNRFEINKLERKPMEEPVKVQMQDVLRGSIDGEWNQVLYLKCGGLVRR